MRVVALLIAGCVLCLAPGCTPADTGTPGQSSPAGGGQRDQSPQAPGGPPPPTSDSPPGGAATDPGDDSPAASPTGTSVQAKPDTHAGVGAGPSTSAAPRRLVFSDEFGADAGIDQATWLVGPGAGVVRIGEGALVLQAGPASRSAVLVTTDDRRSFTYGRIEARIRVPGGTGSTAGLRLLPEDEVYGTAADSPWPVNGQIDVMEAVGPAPTSIDGGVQLVRGDRATRDTGRFSTAVPPQSPPAPSTGAGTTTTAPTDASSTNPTSTNPTSTNPTSTNPTSTAPNDSVPAETGSAPPPTGADPPATTAVDDDSPGTAAPDPAPGPPALSGGFHVYAVDWTRDRMTWSVDGRAFHTVDTSAPFDGRRPFDQQFYLRFDLTLDPAVAATDPSLADAAMTVDWVRVYQ